MYYYELHMHCKEGSKCGVSSIHEMITRYHEIGFSGAVITNHFRHGNTSVDKKLPWEDFVREYAQGYYEGLETAKKLDFDLLFGIEEGYGKGREFLAYGFEPEFLLAHPELETATLAQWYKTLHEAGGFLAYAHPFRVRPYIQEPDAMPDLALADGVELINYCNRPEDNETAQVRFRDSDTIFITGSDLHRAEFQKCCGIGLPHRVHTSAELAQMLKNRRFTLLINQKPVAP